MPPRKRSRSDDEDECCADDDERQKQQRVDLGASDGDAESDQESEAYEYDGETDADGQPHGDGTVSYPESGVVFKGHFCHGVKAGRGTVSYPDGTSVEGTFVDGELSGPGVFTDAEGDRTGCTLVGPVDDEDGTIVGEATFTFPDGSKYCGEWNGEMQAGRFVSATGGRQAQVYRFDPSTTTRISSDPLLPDPFESERVEVHPSLIAGAGEGLFARRDFAQDELVCFYNGVRVTHSVVDGRAWELNANTISLDDETVLDVPPDMNPCSVYRATLGHKVNHAFKPNCRYDWVFHPRFGSIRCVRTLRAVAKGAELTVDYDYNEVTGSGTLQAPDWFLAIVPEEYPHVVDRSALPPQCDLP
ncbi:Histone-lysine N-methyltransferase setd7 [Sorochytrium milnesiophthora]